MTQAATGKVSRAQILEFLDFLGNKGLMNKATVSARKAATNTLLSILSEQEAEDVTNLDLDELAYRFANLRGSSFKPDSIRVYKGRVASVLDDYASYRRDPVSFKPAFTSAGRPASSSTRASNPVKRDQTPGVQDRQIPATSDRLVLPIPIRADLTVQIVGVPSDLTKREATKIANVVMALAVEPDPSF